MGEASSHNTDLTRRTLILIGGVLLFRLAYAALFPVSPAGDEAYYWDWGRQLDYGYYSKPPLIAWLYALVDWIGGGSLFAIRAAAAVLGAVSLFLVFRLASDLFDERTAWIALLLSIAAPANSVLSFFLTIDAPLLACWTLALWMLWRQVSGRGGALTLVVLFLAVGLGHLAKQMMMIFPALAVAFFALNRGSRDAMRSPALWAVLFGSYLSLAPPLLWNARNDWITFQHTGHHFESTSDGGNLLLERIEEFLTFLATQLGVIGPAAAVILFTVSLVALPRIRRAPAPVCFLLVFGAVPLALMLLLALRQTLQPNWPAVFYVSCMILAAAWYSGRLELPFPPAAWRRFLRSTVILSAALSVYFYAAGPFLAAIGKPGHVADPNRRLLGYDRLAAEVEKIREREEGGHDLFVVTLGHRDLASQLAFGLPDQPRVYRWESYDRIVSQYELWNNPAEDGHLGTDAIIVVPNRKPLPKRFARGFSSVEKLDEFELSFGYDDARAFTVYRGKSLESWPEGKPLPDS